MKGKSNHLFQVTSRYELLQWKELIEASTPSIYDIKRYTYQTGNVQMILTLSLCSETLVPESCSSYVHIHGLILY